MPTTDFVRHINDVRRWCLQRSGDCHLAEDVAQDTVVTALRMWEDLRDRDRLRGWLFKIAQRRLLDLTRQRRALPLEQEPLAPIPTEPVESDDARLRVARRALRKLPLDLRRPVRLHYLHGKPLREIALQLGTTRDAVKARLYRARRLMRKEALG